MLRQIRIMHVASSTPLEFWPFSAMQITYVHNCLLSRSTKVIDASMTPFEMRTGRRPVTSTLRVMYSKIVAVYRSSYDKARQSKIDPPTVTGIYLGNHALRSLFSIPTEFIENHVYMKLGKLPLYLNSKYLNSGHEQLRHAMILIEEPSYGESSSLCSMTEYISQTDSTIAWGNQWGW